MQRAIVMYFMICSFLILLPQSSGSNTRGRGFVSFPVAMIWRQTDRARALPAAREPAPRELTALELVTRVRNTEAIESIIATHAIKYLIPFLYR